MEIKKYSDENYVNEIFQKIYPVGSIYLSMNDTNPLELFGFGEWEQIKDRFLLSAGDTYTAGSIGGEAVHTLTIDEMPEHNHTSGTEDNIPLSNNVNYGVSYLASTDTWNYKQGVGKSTTSAPFAVATNDGLSHTHTISSAGNSQPHNNMPPYLVVYTWRRVA